MPISPEDAVGLAKGIREIFNDAEGLLLQRIARAMAKGLDSPDWAEQKLYSIRVVQQEVEAIIDDLNAGVPGAVDRALSIAYNRGIAVAGGELQNVGMLAGAFGEIVNTGVVAAIVRDTLQRVSGAIFQIRRSVNDIYQQTISQTAAQVNTGVLTRRQASLQALTRLTSNGISGFQDRSGRRWDIASYSEMAVRTAAAQAALQGHSDRLSELGIDTVQVSNAPEECSICRPYEGRVLSLTGRTVGDELSDGAIVLGSLAVAKSKGLFHPNCFPGDVLVEIPTGVRAADSRWVDTEVVVIHTASGNELTVTPNHPILTPEGWVAAGQIEVGGSVVRYLAGPELPVVDGPDDESVPAPISEVFHALRGALSVSASQVPSSPEQFHGDGAGSDVEVVRADRLLSHRFDPETGHSFTDAPLVVGGVEHLLLPSESAAAQFIHADLTPPGSLVSAGDLSGSLLCRHGRPLQGLSLGPASTEPVFGEVLGEGGLGSPESFGGFGLAESGLVESDSLIDPRGANVVFGSEHHGVFDASEDPSLGELLVHGGSSDADHAGQVLNSLAGLVADDDVVHVEVRDFSGHVYNLESGDGWYVANSIVVHNCRHSQSIYIPGVTKPIYDTEDPEGDALRQKQRAYERRIRELKRADLIAQEYGGAEARAARVKLRAKQSEFKAWREQHDRKNFAYRTSLVAR